MSLKIARFQATLPRTQGFFFFFFKLIIFYYYFLPLNFFSHLLFLFFTPVSEAAAETTDIVWPANLGVGGMEGTQEAVGTWGAGSAGDMDGTSSVPPLCRMLQRWEAASGCF